MIPFAKLHGLGNDFVLIDARKGAMERRACALLRSRAAIRALSDRKRGIGFDQLLVLKRARGVDAGLAIRNADGGVARMCGNGLRAAALYLWLGGATRRRALTLQTLSGPRSARLTGPLSARECRIECEMGIPRVKRDWSLRPLRVAGKNFRPVRVDVGNPHAVVFRMSRDRAQLAAWGEAIGTAREFPGGVNVEFARERGSMIDVRVWERGVGPTEACGTGAVAAACAAMSLAGRYGSRAVRFPGGRARVRWAGPGMPAYLMATASFVYSGTI